MDAVTWVPRSCRTRSPAPAGRVCYRWLLPVQRRQCAFEPRLEMAGTGSLGEDATRSVAEQNRTEHTRRFRSGGTQAVPHHPRASPSKPSIYPLPSSSSLAAGLDRLRQGRH